MAFKDIAKLRSTLRQVAREWSSDGAKERETTYQPCIDVILTEFPDIEKRPDIKVLCPVILGFDQGCRARKTAF